MTDLALIASDPMQLDPLGHGDAGEFVVLACERAKSWLTQAIEHGDIDQIIEVKSQANAIHVYSRQKELGKDAELAAQEIVRRAERGLGLAVRVGQAAGVIAKVGDIGVGRSSRTTDLLLPGNIFANASEHTRAYELAALTDEQFEDFIADGRDDENLSGANISRKARDEHKLTPKARKKIIAELATTALTSQQIAKRIGVKPERVRIIARQLGITINADGAFGKTKKVDTNKIIERTVNALEGLLAGMALVDFSAVDRTQVFDWDASLKSFQTALTRFRKQLNMEASQ